ncbi:prepilin-type N-terminal cleavage/methylation domain-containing protein [Variovorax sp. LT1P1]|uniref:prepilin-type N-terminal cleavage/methylation domain-containing protein n=1 Tax=Variovorax sp. LT1P1 TaxID=3443730 RepID=UPI003F44B774
MTPIAPSRCSRGFDPMTRTPGPVAGRRIGSTRAAQRGLSLVEVMVAMAIGLFIVLIATTLYVNGASNVGFRMGQSENLGNSRYALGALDNEFTKAGYRRDPTQPMDQAFPADATKLLNGCQFTVGQAAYVNADGHLCIRFQARDNTEKDCVGSAAGIGTLGAYQAPPAPALGAGLFVEKYWVKDGALFCQAGNPVAETQVAAGVRGILFEYGVGTGTDSLAERRVESFKTTTPTANEAIRSLRYAVLLASTANGLTGGMESSVCTRWTELGGAAAACDTSKGKLYQLASGSLTLRNLMP